MPGSESQPRRPGPALSRKVLRITVLRGGPSAERKVSLDSGRAVADALKSRGHDVFVADIGPDQLDALDHPADVVFPALHGTFGEDGTVQRLLEQRRIPFVGAGSRASAIAMDKVAAKKLVAQEGIATPAFEVWNNKTLQARDAPEIPLPVVVKPVNQGSSVATRIVREPGALRPAVQVAVEQFEQALVEQFIAGDELTVGIVGTEALPPICVRPKRTFYDYRAKYQDAATEYLFDAGHPVSLLDRATAWSRRAFERIRCRHLARVDWMADRDGGLWFLEINTIPGFTSHSLVPKAAQRLGISFEDLVERLVFLAVEETP